MSLNDEQTKIIKCVLAGMTNLQIADELGYSPASVKRRLKKIYEIHCASSRLEFVKNIIQLIMKKKNSFSILKDLT